MTKIISIKDEAYHRLKKMKGEQSFTEIIMDLTRRHDETLLDYEGIWSDDAELSAIYDDILQRRNNIEAREQKKW